MDENELLLRHAAKWADQRQRPFDRELMELVLDLRATHDEASANVWPRGSAEHLMLSRWPLHGPLEPPEPDALVTSLDTFWGFLRSTGRMSGASAQPAELRKEAKRAAPKMAAACADPSRFGVAKQLLGFGSDIGIDLSDVSSMDEANARMQQIMDAWNAQPPEERMARSEQWPAVGPVLGDEPLDDDELFDDEEVAWLPDSPLFQFDDDGDLLLPPPLNRDAAAQVRTSGYLTRMIALAEWVGDGKEITTTDTLRPAVARRAYSELRLAEWDRAYWDRETGVGATWLPRGDEPLNWRSATECLALERLWRPALGVGLIATSGRRAHFDPSAVPAKEEEWLRLALTSAIGLLMDWREGGGVELAIWVLALIDAEHGAPTTPEEIAQIWWESPANHWNDVVEERHAENRQGADTELLRKLSDSDVGAWLAQFDDHALWRREAGALAGTEFARDVLILLLAIVDEDVEPF